MSKKCAVILRCHMRTYKYTAKSLINNIIIPNNADLFIFTYNTAGVSKCQICNNSNIENFHKVKGSKEYFNSYQLGSEITYDDFNIYKPYLKKACIIDYDKIDMNIAVPNQDDYYKKVFSLYYTTSESMKMFYDFCKKTDTTYDAVVLSRPDLNYYNKLDVNSLDLDAYNIPKDTGIISLISDNIFHYISSYRNVERGEYIPYRKLTFTDQFIVSSFDNMKPLCDLYNNIEEFNRRGFPINDPEGTFYYITAFLNKKQVKILENFQHEIIRTDFINSLNQWSNENYKPKEIIVQNFKWDVKLFKLPILRIEKNKNSTRVRLFGVSIIKITKKQFT